MKKTLKALMIAGAFLFAAPLVSNALVPGQVVTITLPNNGQVLAPGVIGNGQTYTFVVMQEDDPTDTPLSIEQLELYADGLYINELAALGSALNDDYTLQYLAPVDLGLSAVLGAGAIAAVKRARNRRKQNQVA